MSSSRPSYDVFLKYWMLSVMLSAVAYGVVFTLCCSCVDLLRRTSNTIQKRQNNVLLVYILVMFILSTASVISNVIMVTNVIFSPGRFYGNLLGNTGTITIVFSNWGSDGFLLWRCIILYEGTSRIRRRALLVSIGLLGLMSLAVGITSLAMTFKNNINSSLALFVFACTSLFVNIVITSSIVARLMYFSRNIRATLGHSHTSTYKNIITMLIESAALVVLFGLAYVILTLALPIKTYVPMESLSALVPMESLAHVYVIAPCLIIYRVAQGKEWLNDTTIALGNRDIEMSGTQQGVSTIRFAQARVQDLDSMHETNTLKLTSTK